MAHSLTMHRAVLDTLWRDVAYAMRSLWRTPVFAATVILTVSLGVGAATTIFGLVEALLRPLPVTTPQELYYVAHGAGERFRLSSNYRWLERVRQRTDVFAGVTAYSHRVLKVASDSGTERVFGQHVSGNYHALVGVPMALGRGFASENDRTAGASPVAVISDDYWRRRFGRSPAVIGKTLVVGGRPVTIVGVTAAGFSGLAPGDAVDVTLPLSMRLLDEPDFLDWTDTWTSMPLVARLAPGVGVDAAGAAIAVAFRQYMAEPFNVDFRTVNGEPTVAMLRPAARGDDTLKREYATALQVLSGMAVLVLVIVCVNVAALLVVRGSGGARDIAVRIALGAGRSRVVRPWLAESLALALAGGGVGFLLGGWMLAFVSLLLRGGAEPVVLDLQPNGIVLVFTTAVSALTGLAFGLGPALAASRVDPAPVLKGTPRDGHGRWRPRDVLVAAQVALCLVLVFGAGLLVRTLQNLRSVDGGFDKAGVALLSLDSRDTPLPRERLALVCREVMASLMERSDVLSTSCSTMTPVETTAERRTVTFDGQPRPGTPPLVYANSADAGYFATLGLRIVLGRGILDQDVAGAPAVGVLSRSTARRYFGGSNPIGRTFRWGTRDPGPPITIVGVVEDARLALREAPPEMIYTPLSQRAEPSADLLAAVRVGNANPNLPDIVRERVRAASPEVALTYVRWMDEQIDAALVSERLLAALSTAFGLLALVLACVGLYGALAQDVSRRTRDIGIRLALGATRASVLSSVLQRPAAIVAAGLAAGAIAALLGSRALRQLVFGLEPTDAGTLLIAAAVMTATALAAAWIPARRAVRIDPIRTLRTE